jgi:6,7-dimethyl-8-ribityllumazine synthase
VSSALKNLSSYNPDSVPSARSLRFGIVVAEWNREITGSLLKGAYDTLIRHGAFPENIQQHYVPGSFELTAGAQFMGEYSDVDAIICLGCVIQGETRHFDFICHSVSQGLTQLTLKYNKPFIFGVLTPDNQQQALDRAGGKHGNKGDEAAVTAIKMAALQQNMRNQEA